MTNLRPENVHQSPEWHDKRRLGLGSSDAAGALGLSTYRRPIDVWRDKRGLNEPVPDNRLFEWGRRLEPAIADAAADATGIDWRRFAPEVRCRQWPIAYAHLDRRAREPESGDATFLECKSAMNTRDWGVSGTTVSIADAHDVMPAGYAIQVAHELLVTGFPHGYMAALLGYRDFRWFKVTADADYLSDLLADEQAFWQMVVDGVEPEPDGSDAYRAHLAQRRAADAPEERSATPEQQAIGARLLSRKASLDTAKADYEEERQRLDRSMGSVTKLVGPGWTATRTLAGTQVEWKTVVKEAGAAGLDLEPFIAANSKPTEPSFRFVPSAIKEG